MTTSGHLWGPLVCVATLWTFGAEAVVAQCTNTCTYAFDGDCDDGGPGADYSLCEYGTDCDDCGPRSGGGSLCTDTCRHAFDGDCDDGGPGSDYSICDYGTDCGDCGPRAPGGARSGELCTNTCRYAFDGDCDDGGWGSDFSLCDFGTDCADCGVRYASDRGPCSAGGVSPGSGLFLGLLAFFAVRARRRRR
ncbi:MAG: hypothetical protein KF901_14315 [Myxococcales bacterium]|nr:hypothetical protein [Myxococcales bacterium]